jgi:hypothetical protein
MRLKENYDCSATAVCPTPSKDESKDKSKDKSNEDSGGSSMYIFGGVSSVSSVIISII